jgi:HlyD family secretion protein
MTANVSVIVDEKKDVLKVPNAALRFKPSDRTKVGQADLAKGGPAAKAKGGTGEKGPGVWVIEDEKPKRIRVSVGISDGSFTELISGGLKEGQDVIVESLIKPKQQSTTGPRMF